MDWIKKNPEKLVLLLIALACLGVGVKHILGATSLPEKFEVSDKRASEDFPTLENGPVTQSEQILKADFIWLQKKVPIPGGKEKEVPTMRSVWIIEKDGELIDPLNPESELLRPPVSNQWLLDHNLEFLSRDVLSQDPDNDGFSSLDEWHAKTSPVDPGEYPPLIQKLLFAERKQQNFSIKFAANNNPSYQVNWTDRGRRGSKFVKVGDTFYEGRFTVLSFTEKEGKVRGITQDLSEVVLMDHQSNKEITLILRQEIPWPTYFAEFNFTLDPSQSQFYVPIGETFTLSMEPSTSYRLIDVTADAATVQATNGSDPVVLPRGALMQTP